METMQERDNQISEEVSNELHQIRQQQRPFNSAHEAYGVISEEVAEFFDEVRLKRKDRNPLRMRHELTQIAAVAIRAATDLTF